MATKRRKVAKVVNENMNPLSFGWEDVFYITNLNDGTRFYRAENPNEQWYNLCLKPNPIYPECRHYCVGCGSNYEKFLILISKYVSRYRQPENMYDAFRNLTDRGRVGKVMLGYDDDWWDEFGATDYVMCCNDDINEAIEIGKQTTVHGDEFSNVKVTFNENEESFFIEGRWAEWFEEFVDKIMNFKGHTKVEFLKALDGDVEVDGCNEIFAELKRRGCKGIKQMKQIGLFQWLDILAPLVNDWYFENESSINSVYSSLEEDDE